MESKRGILLIIAITAVAVLTLIPCSYARDNGDEDGQRREGQRMQRPGDGPGEMPGLPPSDERFGRDGPARGRPRNGWRRPELTEEQIDDILEELKKRDPNTVKELADLRKEDRDKFKTELRRHAFPEIGKVIMEIWAKRQRAEFLEWLEKYVPKVAEELTQLEEKEPELYAQKYDLTWHNYRRIYDRAKRSPELAKVLVADLQMEEREEALRRQIRTTENEEDKNELIAQLEEVVSDRYELIVRQKQIEYNQLLKRLEALQNQVKASIQDIEKWKDPENKTKIVNKRMKELTTPDRERRFWPDH